MQPLAELVRSLPIITLPIVVEENVKRQVENISKTQIIIDAWKEGRDVDIHGLVYDLASGTLHVIPGVSRGRTT